MYSPYSAATARWNNAIYGRLLSDVIQQSDCTEVSNVILLNAKWFIFSFQIIHYDTGYLENVYRISPVGVQ